MGVAGGVGPFPYDTVGRQEENMEKLPPPAHPAAHAVFAHLAGKWSASILHILAGAALRFSQLRSRITGVSDKVLAQTLRELERDGLILRTSYPVVPPHVVYSLTPLGDACAEHVAGIFAWLTANENAFVRAQCHYDVATMQPNGLAACDKPTDSDAAA